MSRRNIGEIWAPMTFGINLKNLHRRIGRYRKKKGQKGMILTHNAKTGKLISFRMVYKYK